ncbi:MAG: response regulator [Candidatus Moraniibacteriota bacterium]
MPKILFVEDDPFIAEIYKKKFETAGFSVVNVTTGKQVLAELASNRYDITLLDLVLPEMGGFDILHEVRTAPGYPKDARIIIFSNLSSPEDRDRAVKLGADGFISKTEYTPSRVVEEVNRYLRQFDEQGKNVVRIGTETASSTGGADRASLSAHAEGKRILIIEDEPVFVELFSKRLMDEGYTVVTKENGEAGLEEALKNPYDLIITDAVLPGLTGGEIIEKLRSEESHRNIPILLLSASLDSEQFEIASVGATKAFLKTEITPSEIVYEVNGLLSERPIVSNE